MGETLCQEKRLLKVQGENGDTGIHACRWPKGLIIDTVDSGGLLLHSLMDVGGTLAKWPVSNCQLKWRIRSHTRREVCSVLQRAYATERHHLLPIWIPSSPVVTQAGSI